MDEVELPREARELVARATRLETPCGDGTAVWHLWGNGTPVVLLHGGSGSWNHWLKNIPALVAAGRRVVVPDLPGFGDSATPRGGGDADAAVEPIVRGMKMLLGIDAVEIVGFSFGSLVAVLLASLHPSRVSRLLLVGAPVVPLKRGRGVELKPWSRTSTPLERNSVHRHNLAAIMLHRAESLDDTAIALQALNVPRDRMKRRSLVTTTAFGDALALVRCPYSAIYGGEDVLCRGIWAEVEEALRSNPRFEGMSLITAAGHWVQYEEAERFNHEMLRALESAGAAR